VSQKLNDINSIIRNTNPPPPPAPPPQPRGVVFKGKFETAEFTFEARDLYQLNTQCTTFVLSNGLTNVDDISVSVNFGPIQILRNTSSYWKTPYQICAQLNPIAQAAGLQAPRGQTIVVGSIETVDFEFAGYNVADISRQCEMLVNSKSSLSNVDDIIMSVNFGTPLVLRNTSGYWKGAFEICNQIIQKL
jgi:hypothetical protein